MRIPCFLREHHGICKMVVAGEKTSAIIVNPVSVSAGGEARPKAKKGPETDHDPFKHNVFRYLI